MRLVFHQIFLFNGQHSQTIQYKGYLGYLLKSSHMTIVATWRNARPSIFQVFIVVTPNIHTYRALVQELSVQYRFCSPQKDLQSILQWT